MSRRTREPEGVDDALEPEDEPTSSTSSTRTSTTTLDDDLDAELGGRARRRLVDALLDPIDLTPTEDEKAAAAAESDARAARAVGGLQGHRRPEPCASG